MRRLRGGLSAGGRGRGDRGEDSLNDSGPIEVWRGGVNAWECDEMGHMNVRFYLARAMQGLAGAAAALGMPLAFSARAQATLAVREHHIRYLREARAGAPLHMTAGVVGFDETDATLLQVLTHSRTGEAAATFVTRVSHVTAGEGRAFPWPVRTAEAAARLQVQATPECGPRSVADPPRDPARGTEAAKLAAIARGAVAAEDCDVFGRMRPEMVLARVSEGLPHLVEPLRSEAQAMAGPEVRVGGAALEMHLSYFARPRAGDLLELRSGIMETTAKFARFRHWLTDPRTGAAWAAVEQVSLNFDLDARRSIVLSDAALERLKPYLATVA